MKSYNESYSENDSNGNNQSEEKSKYNGNDNENENKDNNGNDNGNDNGNSKSENNVYWCFGEASEYKGWVIKLVLTTPVKFQEKVKFSLSLSTLNTLRLFISLHY